MKHTLLYFAAALLMAACSTIEPEDRLQSIPPLAESQIRRNVLIEDFTGQHCPNCPTAATVIEQQEALYGSHVVCVSIHSGGTSLGTRLRTTYGQERFLLLGDASLPQPAVQVDRCSEILTGGPGVTNGLSPILRNRLQRTTTIALSDFQAEKTGEDQYTLSLNAMSTINENIDLQIWVTEDNIISDQSMPDGSVNKNYLHQNVLRATATPNDGIRLNLKAGTPQPVSQELTTKSNWKTENIRLVVIASRPSGEVLQVERYPLAK